jgi:2,3-bisphosphoglycerate-independent phosphoglycerate mutase
MKYAIIIPDGASDEPSVALGGKTPFEAARIPFMDDLARSGVLGRSRNVPDQFLPASDVATLSLFGYDPSRYYTGRAPLEVVAMGIELGPLDWAVRCNLVTINEGRMTDFTAGHISSPEAAALIESIRETLSQRFHGVEFYPGVSYRNAMVVREQTGDAPRLSEKTCSTPPHDIPDLMVANYLPSGTGAEWLRDLMIAAAGVLGEHTVNSQRVRAGKLPATSIWLWGQGKAPRVPAFSELHGIQGAIISAVDLVRGTAQLAGWNRIDVPGATGYLDTDYAAKGRYAIEALQAHDLVCVHVEAPDEASHEGRADAKVESIEQIDRLIVGPVHEALRAYGDYRILVSPDHSTFLRTRAHDRAPVAWAMCGTGLRPSGYPYDEQSASSAGGPFLEEGWRLMDAFLAKR